MRHAIAKEGFTYCGLIHCWNGDERLAFHLSKHNRKNRNSPNCSIKQRHKRKSK